MRTRPSTDVVEEALSHMFARPTSFPSFASLRTFLFFRKKLGSSPRIPLLRLYRSSRLPLCEPKRFFSRPPPIGRRNTVTHATIWPPPPPHPFKLQLPDTYAKGGFCHVCDQSLPLQPFFFPSTSGQPPPFESAAVWILTIG